MWTHSSADCEGWMKWKKAVPRYRPDGSLYYIDHDHRGRAPTGSMPPGMTGSRAMSEVSPAISMAPTPQEFTVPPTTTAPTPQEFSISTPVQGLGREMDWEALDLGLDEERGKQEADDQLSREASEAREEEGHKAEEQLSREASEYPEARTPSSTATVIRFRSPRREASVRSRSTPAVTRERQSESGSERDGGGESFQDAMKESLGEQERKIERSMEILEAATEDNRRGLKP